MLMARTIRVKVHTKTYDDRIEEVNIDEYEVWLTSAPADGEANIALIELLAEFFDIPPSTIHIKSGLKSRHKLIQID